VVEWAEGAILFSKEKLTSKFHIKIDRNKNLNISTTKIGLKHLLRWKRGAKGAKMFTNRNKEQGCKKFYKEKVKKVKYLKRFCLASDICRGGNKGGKIILQPKIILQLKINFKFHKEIYNSKKRGNISNTFIWPQAFA